MKLPASKKDRLQVLVSWGIGVLALVSTTYELAWIPFMQSWDDQEKEYGKVEANLTKAREEVAKAPTHAASYSNILEQVQAISENDILQPVLGTFLLGVREMIEDAAHSCGVKIEPVRELGILDTSGKKGKHDSAFRRYAAQVSGSASYEQLYALIGKLEEGNAYLCVSSIHLMARSDDPESHRFTFTIEWPIWRNPEMAPPARKTRGEATRE